jgi:hypothetical protein
MTRELLDKAGKNSQERFLAIRRCFLECLEISGHSRTELYYRPKPGDLREPTEEEVVRRWAEFVDVPVNDILIGIARAFLAAGDSGKIVTSFRYCVPHIQARLNEMRDARVGG